jgi:hypothetical protein
MGATNSLLSADTRVVLVHLNGPEMLLAAFRPLYAREAYTVSPASKPHLPEAAAGLTLPFDLSQHSFINFQG